MQVWRLENTRYAPLLLPAFRAAHGLPPTFGVALFQPKDTTGLGTVDGAAGPLAAVRADTLAATPADCPPHEWVNQVARLTDAFDGALRAANAHVGLREPELAFAAQGFGDVLGAWAFAGLRASLLRQPVPPFDDVYATWLAGTLRAGGDYAYHHAGDTWRVRVVTHAYGRVGLLVTLPTETVAVWDKALACPAEAYMRGLMGAVAEKLGERGKVKG